MKTDVVALEAIVAAAVGETRAADGSVSDDALKVAVDDRSAQSIDIRVDRELTPAEVSAIANAALGEFDRLEQERLAEPHIVSQPDAFEVIDEGTGRRYVGAVDCPDCTRGLISRGADFVCVQVPRRATLKGTLPGDIVACGRPR